MKTSTVVAWNVNAPLGIETVDLEGPKAGGKIAIDALITHTPKLKDINHSFELTGRGGTRRHAVWLKQPP